MKFRICIDCSEQEADFLQKKFRGQGIKVLLQRSAFCDFEVVLVSEKEISENEIDNLLKI